MSDILKSAKIGLRVIETWSSKHLPAILTSAATIGVVGGTVIAVKQTPGCKKELDEAKAEWMAIPDREKCNIWDYRFKLVRIGAKWYWQVVAIDGLAIFFMWEANHVNAKRLAAAIAGGKIFSDKLEALEEQIRQDGGEKKLQNYRDKIMEKQVSETEYDPEKIYGVGDCLCYDPVGDHLFMSSIEKLRYSARIIEDNLYDQLVDGDSYAFYPLNDFFLNCGAPTDADFGNKMGWVIEMSSPDKSPKEIRSMIHDVVNIGFGSAIKNGMPVLAIQYLSAPRYNYYEF